MGRKKVYLDNDGILHYNVDHSTAKEAMEEIEEMRRVMKFAKEYTDKDPEEKTE